jgi:nucleoside-diphosphate-sugar epimerase
MMVTGNVCVTGATGFVGKNLVKSLQALGGMSVTVITRSKESCEKIKELNTECYLDDGDTEHLIGFFRERKFDTVIHLASLYLKDHHSKQIDDLISSNILFSTRLLEASVKSSVKSFINTGTLWQHYEDKLYSPVNLYAATKQALEAIAQYFRETSGLFFTTVYLNDTYGPGDTRKKILNIWNSMGESDRLDMSPGEQIINLLHIDDVVDGYIKLIKLVQSGKLSKDSSSAFVLKAKEELTLRQLAVLFERIAGKKLNINWGGHPYKSREVMTVWDKGVAVPGWTPRVSLDEGLKQFVLLAQA